MNGRHADRRSQTADEKVSGSEPVAWEAMHYAGYRPVPTAHMDFEQILTIEICSIERRR
jgi:hypothetical protein